MGLVTLTFDLETGIRVSSTVGNLSSEFGHARPIWVLELFAMYATDGRTKATLIVPFSTVRDIIILFTREYCIDKRYEKMRVLWRQDTLREDCNDKPDCERNCCVNRIIAPVFFVVFVLMAQFVLVNVVVAVLMKHLEVCQSRDVGHVPSLV